MQADINWIIAELREVKDPDLIGRIKSLLSGGSSNTEDEELLKALDEAYEDKKARRVVPHEEVRKRYSKWL